MWRTAWTAWRRKRLYRRALAAPARTVIFRYHSVGDPLEVATYVDPGLSLTPERFRQHLRAIGQHFDIVPVGEIPERLARPRPRPAAAITFDDGYRDNHDVALPILIEEGAPAAFFVTTDPLLSLRPFWISELRALAAALPPGASGLEPPELAHLTDDAEGRRRWQRAATVWLSGLSAGARDEALDLLARRAGRPRGEGLEGAFMRPEHVVALQRHGMTVGAHTRTHPHLDRLAPEQHEAEVSGSRADLERVLGTAITAFAYPNPGGNGAFGEAARRSVARAGFTLGFTSRPDPTDAHTDPLRFPRLGVYAGPQERLLFALVAEPR